MSKRFPKVKLKISYYIDRGRYAANIRCLKAPNTKNILSKSIFDSRSSRVYTSTAINWGYLEEKVEKIIKDALEFVEEADIKNKSIPKTRYVVVED